MNRKDKVGSQNCLHPHLTSKKIRSSDTQSISKFFQFKKINPELNQNHGVDILETESPYKNAIKVSPMSQNNSFSDYDDDFQLAKVPKKANLKWTLSKGRKSQTLPKKRAKKKSKSSNMTLKITEDNFKYNEENGNHLQMAIALSKSSYERENSSQCSLDETPNVSEILNIQNTKMSVLEKYGFSSVQRLVLPATNKKPNLEVNFRAKSRFKYITPILNIRTNQERQALIASKVSHVLSENNPKISGLANIPSSISNIFKCYMPKEGTIFNFDSEDKSEFYVKGLNFPKSYKKSGYLLRDWSNIPGRDISPSRNVDAIEVTRSPKDNDTKNESHKEFSEEKIPVLDIQKQENHIIDGTKSGHRSTSPDLFGPDYDSDNFASYTEKKLTACIVINKSTVLPTEDDLNPSVPEHTEVERLIVDDISKEVDIIDLTNSNDDDNRMCVKVSNINSNFYNLDEFENNDDNKWKDESPVMTDTNSQQLSIFSSSEELNKFDILDVTDSCQDAINLESYGCNTFEKNDIELKKTYSVYHISNSSNISLSNSSDPSPNNHLANLKDLTQSNIIVLSDNEPDTGCQPDYSNHQLHDTPKRFSKRKSKSLGSYSSKFYDSAELNVTDYVEKLLNQENYSFNQSDCKSDLESGNDNKNAISLSQGSQKSVISDEELNYSSYFCLGGANIGIEEINKMNERVHATLSFQRLPSEIIECIGTSDITPSRLIIKTNSVTPIPNYDEMSTPLLHKELEKYGIKPLKRVRGAKLLKHIYESTHPVIRNDQIVPEYSDSDEDGKEPKKMKFSQNDGVQVNSYNLSPNMNSCRQGIEIIGDCILENEKTEDLIFERKQSVRIPSCAVPLQIVWHNFVSSNLNIKENILLYEPLQLESLHMMLKEQGFKFHIQDILTFLDRKCITIRTAQHQNRKKSILTL